MSATSTGLLRVARDCSDGDAWCRLTSLYEPLLHGWLRRQGVPHADAEDLVQDTLAVVAQELPTFTHNGRQGAFRCWLRGILANRLRSFRRAQRVRSVNLTSSDLLERLADQLADAASDLSLQWDADHDRFILRRCLERIEPEFAPTTWQAFRRWVLEGTDPEQVAAALGISLTAVYNAKYRVMKRLRQVAQEFCA